MAMMMTLVSCDIPLTGSDEESVGSNGGVISDASPDVENPVDDNPTEEDIDEILPEDDIDMSGDDDNADDGNSGENPGGELIGADLLDSLGIDYTSFALTCAAKSNGKARKCKLPKTLKGRILALDINTQVVGSNCVQGENLNVLNNMRGIKVSGDCSGLFTLYISNNLNRKKYGGNKSWSGLDYLGNTLASGISITSSEEEQDLDVLLDGSYGDVVEAQLGLGVDGGQVVPSQINHDPDLDVTETIVFTLPENTIAINLIISNLFPKENGGERGFYQVYNEDGEMIANGNIDHPLRRYKKHNVADAGKLPIRNILGGKYLVVGALSYSPEYIVDGDHDSSDFYVHSLITLTVTE